MPVFLFDADDHVVAPAVRVLGFANGEVDSFALIVAMTDHPALVVYDVPAILGFVVIDMKGVL